MSTFEIILPTLGISFIGWALIKFNVISEGARSGISTLTFSILIPALLFKGMYEAREIEQFPQKHSQSLRTDKFAGYEISVVQPDSKHR